jgi:hypothetical protein
LKEEYCLWGRKRADYRSHLLGCRKSGKLFSLGGRSTQQPFAIDVFASLNGAWRRRRRLAGVDTKLIE